MIGVFVGWGTAWFSFIEKGDNLYSYEFHVDNQTLQYGTSAQGEIFDRFDVFVVEIGTLNKVPETAH